MKKLLLLILPALLLWACSPDDDNGPDKKPSGNPTAETISFTETRNAAGGGETFELEVTSNVTCTPQVPALYRNAVKILETLAPNHYRIKVEANDSALPRTLKLDVVAAGGTRKTLTILQEGSPMVWGLGDVVSESVSNNRPYSWYVDQGNTGPESFVNCGPASTRMAAHWANSSFTPTTAALRTESGVTGWWYTSNIQDMLRKYGITHHVFSLNDFEEDLKPIIDDGYVVILCLDMYYVRQEAAGHPEWRKDKFYVTENPEWGHFIVAKGYKNVDGKYLAEVYDPWSLGVKYADGTFKGRDRYYRAEDIITATDVWWPYMIAVAPPSAVRSSYAPAGALDPSAVPAQRGR